MCDGLCDPDFAIAHMSIPNYAAQKIHLLATVDGACEGDRCPADVGEPTYEGAPLVPCVATPEAAASPLGAEEHCRVSPLVGAFGIELGFTTPVERSSFEELTANLETGAPEPYLWHSEVVSFEGPGTAFRGVIEGSGGTPDVVRSAQNLTCIDRLDALGIAWTADSLATACAATWDDGGTLRPMSMAPTMAFESYRGRQVAGGGSCDDDGCCSHCDYQLSVGVAKYGVTEAGVRRDPSSGTAITCDPSADVLTECSDFAASVDRSLDASEYVYAWDGASQSWPLPLGDKLRETHPDRRPAGLEAPGASCDDEYDCDEGLACLAGTCRVPWAVECVASPSTTGSTGFCVDARFDDYAAGACHVVTADFGNGSAGDRLSVCDEQGNGLGASECCDPALGGGDNCDPVFQPGVVPVDREDREPGLIALAQCVCDEASAADPACAQTVETWCAAPLGAPDPALVPSVAGDWAARPLTHNGGVRLDEMHGVVEVRISDLGGQPRAQVESCAEGRGLIPHRDVADRWHEEYLPERIADHDLSLCSGSTYRVHFATSEADTQIRSEAGGTLDGRSVLVFETPQFRIVPGSAFPPDDLDVGACDDFEIRLSNRYDLSPMNLRKLALYDSEGVVVAGGPTCNEYATPEEVAAGALPCLTVDVADQHTGVLAVLVDRDRFGNVLVVGQRYRLVVPGLSSIAAMSDAAAYAAAFHDACGMPLILGEGEDVLALSEVSFEIDHGCD